MVSSQTYTEKIDKQFSSKIKFNFPIKDLTTLGVGGLAKKLIVAKTQPEVIQILKTSQRLAIPYLVIGSGSNLLVSDNGVDKLIIKNEVSGIERNDKKIIVKGGTLLQWLVDFSIKNGLAGLQNLTGIPGTVGGAIYGNAGAYGQTISDHLTSVSCWDGSKVIHLSKPECQFAYRDSGFKINHFVILEAEFELVSDNASLLSSQSEHILSKRLVKYPPGLKCPGSFFKNIIVDNISSTVSSLIPKDKVTFGKISAGYFLEEVGAKGQKEGDIEVAQNHANLFVNLGQGKASDLYKLASDLAIKVEVKFGLKLEPEVQFINLPPLLRLDQK